MIILSVLINFLELLLLNFLYFLVFPPVTTEEAGAKEAGGKEAGDKEAVTKEFIILPFDPL